MSNDRHASHDSPYRTGQHIPLPQSRHTPLSSVATSAIESQADLSSPYTHDDITSNGNASSTKSPPRSPYLPGMKSALVRQSTADSSEIQMQNFNDGLPPPPPVSHSWKRIDHWTEDNLNELFDNIGYPCTQNDVNELEHELDCTLPMDVRESLTIHDGQERGGLPTGLFFGCMLLDCEEIVEEWTNWKKVNDQYLNSRPTFETPQIPVKAFAGSSSSTAVPVAASPRESNQLWKQELQSRQESQPPGAIQRAYAHPAWIPLARDWGGNCIAVDLAPGPNGRWGQVIIFGRDYDCKYVIARSWAHFLAIFADDLSSEKVHLGEEDDHTVFKLLEFKQQQGVEPPYLEILRWRCDQKHGRRGPKRRSAPPNGLHINSNMNGGSSSRDSSPYGSPVERTGSPHRFSGKAAASPRMPVSSPLARVAEEDRQPIRIHTDAETLRKNSAATKANEKLVSVDTPRPSGDIGSELLSRVNTKENTKLESPLKAVPANAGELKTVAI